MKHTNIILVGGWSLILFAILFVGINIAIDLLAKDQPILYNLENYQLFQVIAGTDTIRAALILFALSPLLLIPGALGAYYEFEDNYEAHMCIGKYFAIIGTLGLVLNLMMIPSISWHLTTYIQTLSAHDQIPLIIILQALHNYFGIFVGDFLGLGSLLVWFFITSLVIMRSGKIHHLVGYIQLIISILITLSLLVRYTNLMPYIHFNIQISALIALWCFILGFSLVSLRRD